MSFWTLGDGIELWYLSEFFSYSSVIGERGHSRIDDLSIFLGLRFEFYCLKIWFWFIFSRVYVSLMTIMESGRSTIFILLPALVFYLMRLSSFYSRLGCSLWSLIGKVLIVCKSCGISTYGLIILLLAVFNGDWVSSSNYSTTGWCLSNLKD